MLIGTWWCLVACRASLIDSSLGHGGRVNMVAVSSALIECGRTEIRKHWPLCVLLGPAFRPRLRSLRRRVWPNTPERSALFRARMLQCTCRNARTGPVRPQLDEWPSRPLPEMTWCSMPYRSPYSSRGLLPLLAVVDKRSLAPCTERSAQGSGLPSLVPEHSIYRAHRRRQSMICYSKVT